MTRIPFNTERGAVPMRPITPVAGLALLLALAAAGCSDATPAPVEPASIDIHAAATQAPASFDISVPGGTHVDVLAAHSGFQDEVDAQFRIKQDGRTTRVANVRDASDVVMVRLTLEEGGSVGWHTHPGPAIVAVETGTLGIINAYDCVERRYQTGEALIDPGLGNVHVGFNAAESGHTVLYVTFLGIPTGEPATVPAEPAC